MEDDIKSQFIVGNDYNREATRKLASKALKFGRITQDGSVIIDNKNLSPDDKIKLALTIKFLAHNLDEKISASLKPGELTAILGERNEAVGSRFSAMAKNGFAKREGHGNYIIHHYRIEPFLDNLSGRENSSADKAGGGHKRAKRNNSSGELKSLTGIGLDIQSLIDKGFFKTPKFISDTHIELKKEVKFYNPKVLDMTIRKTFVSNRRTLKRIPNEEGGKAKWKYVIR